MLNIEKLLRDMTVEEKAALVSGTDYERSYENNDKVGQGIMTVTGKGNFTDSIQVTFTITPTLLTMR